MFLSTDSENIGTVFKCRVCGNRVNPSYYPKDSETYAKICEKRMCYECAYWTDLMNNPFKYMQVIDHIVYEFLPWKCASLGELLGKTMYILCKNGQAKRSNDVWVKGKVPDRFIKDFPDTAYQIDKKTYVRLCKGGIGCTARACRDRYHCYRYDYRGEFRNGPFNMIPRDWIVGNEKCPAFVNLLSIKNYDLIDINDILFNLNTGKK